MGIISYFKRIFDSISQFINVAIFFGDNSNECVAGRAYRLRREPFWGFMKRAIDILFFFDADHCYQAYNDDLSRAAKTMSDHRKYK